MAKRGVSGGLVSLLGLNFAALRGTALGRAIGQQWLLGSAFPLSLPWSGFWRANYSVSSWLGTATDGPTLGRKLTESSTPMVAGTPQNGYTPAAGGISTLLTADGPAEQYIGTNTCFIHCVVKLGSVVGPAANVWDDACLLVTGSAATVALGASSSGVAFGVYTSGGPVQTSRVALASGSYAVVQARLDGVNASVSVDGGSWTNVAAADITSGGGNPLIVGADLTGVTTTLDASILEIGVSQKSFSDATALALVAYSQARYAIGYTSRCLVLLNGLVKECPDTGPFGQRLVLSSGRLTTTPTGGKSLVLVSGRRAEAATETGVRVPP